MRWFWRVVEFSSYLGFLLFLAIIIGGTAVAILLVRMI